MPRQQPFDARAALAAERARVLAEQAARERAELVRFFQIYRFFFFFLLLK